jgi:hypothetical protein
LRGPLGLLLLLACSAEAPPEAEAAARAALAQGRLREGEAAAAALRQDYPDDLDGWLIGAEALELRHDRGATEALLVEAYQRRPAAFPAFRELVDHRLRGPDDVQRGLKVLAEVDAHLAARPGDQAQSAQGQMVVLAYLLGQPALPAERRPALESRAAALLASAPAGGDTLAHYDRAQLLLALGRRAEAWQAAEAGIAADTHRWDALTLEWALICEALHGPAPEEARRRINGLLRKVEDWPGLHFGQGKPLWEWVQLTLRLRWGEALPTPTWLAPRLEALEREQVKLQYGDAEVRQRSQALLLALDRGDRAGADQAAQDLLMLLGRDRGCEMENHLIRPHARWLLLRLRARLAEGRGETALASSLSAEAQALFPADPWTGPQIPSP